MNIKCKLGANRINEIGNPKDAVAKLEHLKKYGNISNGKFVKIDELKVEGGVERFQGPRITTDDKIKISELAQNMSHLGFDWNDGAIVVATNPKDNTIWVVDGRHRTKALRSLDQDSIWVFELEFTGRYSTFPFHTALRKAGAPMNEHKTQTPNDEPAYAYNLRCDLGLEKAESYVSFEGPVTPATLKQHLRSEFRAEEHLTPTRITRIANAVYNEWKYATNTPKMVGKKDTRITRVNKDQAAELSKSLQKTIKKEKVHTQSYYADPHAAEAASAILSDGDSVMMWTKEFSDSTKADESMEASIRKTYESWAAMFAGTVDVIKKNNTGNDAVKKLDWNAPSLEWYLENNEILVAAQTQDQKKGSYSTGESRVKRILFADLPSQNRNEKAA